MGDMVGAPFEFDRGPKSKNFRMFSNGTHFTDDTVMTIAVAEALLAAGQDAEEDTVRQYLIGSMKSWELLTRTPATVRGSTSGCSQIWKNPTAAMATGVPCGYLPPAGCTIPWMKPGSSPGSAPR